MTPSSALLLSEEGRAHLDALGEANRAFVRQYPGERPVRQPVHTVYGGAHLFRAETTRRLGELAAQSMAIYARDAGELARGLGFRDAGASLGEAALGALYARVQAKLSREPVEDFRLDFEDGFGARPDDEEDAVARTAAGEVARGIAGGHLPPFIGIRIKSFGDEWKDRGARTLGLFIDELLAASGGRLPDNFVVTLPKVQPPEGATHQEIAQACWDSIEPVVRKDPAPWLWMYKHWRYKPVAATRPYPFYAQESPFFEQVAARSNYAKLDRAAALQAAGL